MFVVLVGFDQQVFFTGLVQLQLDIHHLALTNDFELNVFADLMHVDVMGVVNEFAGAEFYRAIVFDFVPINLGYDVADLNLAIGG